MHSNPTGIFFFCVMSEVAHGPPGGYNSRAIIRELGLCVRVERCVRVVTLKDQGGGGW